MYFVQQLPTFSVETENGSTLYPSLNLAEIAYQKFVKENIPVEFFRDGILEKGTRVPNSFHLDPKNWLFGTILEYENILNKLLTSWPGCGII